MKYYVLAVALALAIIATGCSGSITGNVAHEDTIEIGAALCLSGVCAHTGTMAQKGIDLAVAEINLAGGVDGKQIKVTYEDITNGDARTGVNAVTSLLQRDIDIIFGPSWSAAALAVAPVTCQEEALLISTTVGVSEFAPTCATVLLARTPDEPLSEAIAKKAYDDGHRKFAVLGSTQAWEDSQANTIASSFSELGGEVVLNERPLAEVTDFKTELLKVKRSGATAMYAQFTYADLIAKQARELGIEIPIYLVLIDDARLTSGGVALEGTTIVTSFNPSEQFNSLFESVYAEPADFGSDVSYDALHLLAQSIEATKSTDTTILAKHILDTTIGGESGLYGFDTDGNGLQGFSFLEVQNGELVRI